MCKSLSFSTLALALLCAGSQATHAEDLLQIYQMARGSDPQLAAASASQGSVGEGVAQARAALLPQISANMSYGKDSSDSSSLSPVRDASGNFTLFPILSSSENHKRSYQAQLTQTIYDHSNYMRLKASRAQAARGDSDYAAALQNLLLRVSTSYFAVLTSEDALKFAESNEKALARQLDQAEQRFEVGLSAITDVHDARARHDAAVASVIEAQNALDDTREALGEITGKVPGDLKRLRENLPLNKPEPSDPQVWVDTALKDNPLLASRQHFLDAAEYNISTQRAGHYPTLNASIVRTDLPSWNNQASTFTSGTSIHTDNWSGDTTIGVTLNVPIFSGGLTSSRVRQAIFDRDNAQYLYEQQRRAVIHQTRTAFRAVIAGISDVEARKQTVISAESALEATQAGFEVGTRTIVDVLLSQQNLFQAQSDYSKARHAFVLNGLQLKQSAGTIDVADLESVNALLE